MTGNPVRASFQAMRRETASAVWKLRPGKKTLLIFGGSQGARSINEAVGGCLAELLVDFNLLWQTGRSGMPESASKETIATFEACNALRVLEFIEDMPSACSAADLAVCRAGAMTIAELAICELPAIFVPFPFAADDHQTANARALVECSAAEIVKDSELSPQMLLDSIRAILQSEERFSSMRAAMKPLAKPNAARDIADIVLKLCSK
jgi:UDP-N-acetylglucosamine--N-acetylmuramyl-(pentapeptide) pyrophosphoryl-undecaprenol N-acetylglucosamine transferase